MRPITSPVVRKILRIALPAVVIPGVVLLGALLFPAKRHGYVSMAVTVLAFLLFLSGFERRRTGSGRLVLVAVMTALAVVGRMIPYVKPVAALTILTGMYLGAECGFLSGALTAVVSNFAFGQGPWTPFQMFSWGLIGLAAGLLARPLQKSRTALLLFGALAGGFFSLVMDVWSVLWYGDGLRLSLYRDAVVYALPFTVLYALSNLLFLALMARPFGAKLSRICRKYGL